MAVREFKVLLNQLHIIDFIQSTYFSVHQFFGVNPGNEKVTLKFINHFIKLLEERKYTLCVNETCKAFHWNQPSIWELRYIANVFCNNKQLFNPLKNQNALLYIISRNVTFIIYHKFPSIQNTLSSFCFYYVQTKIILN